MYFVHIFCAHNIERKYTERERERESIVLLFRIIMLCILIDVNCCKALKTQ